MTKRMLIDATHKEETRVAITDGNKLVEYDYESQSRKPLKGSIFLAKVTRVEPSLQAAFVNFGGNRHGFLPFSEIHPDYFRIPVADREALMAEQEALLQEHDEEENSLDEDPDGEEPSVDDIEAEIVEPEEVGGELGALDDDAQDEVSSGHSDDSVVEEEEKPESCSEDDNESPEGDDNSEEETSSEGDDQEDGGDKNKNNRGRGRGNGRGGRGRGNGRGGRGRAQNRNRSVEVVGGEEIDEEQRFRFNLRRKYKIQEVIKRGQIMLVQVNKEERGNKGAAVGSYLSLPGRYCVLMPNSPRAGGVSRKIANHKDRARMRDIVKDLEVPKGMSVIVRTAGVTRTKVEIKRDLDYLMRLWDNIRSLTLESTAPALVYEEADLIKRSVRDLYTRDVEEILVSGQDGYDTAKNFMKMMIPSHVKKVKQYEHPQLPLFNRYQIESQIDEIGQTEVRLRSGGYLVINPTEALVSIDVNSGKATKGRHIEETAVKTNLEAADEVARQLKLRDLGGLVVIDFIDMEDRRNNGKVERRMKDALSTDRARVQVGRISSFGLMELSRQRLSPSLTEAQYEKCSKCNGLGLIRTADAMSILVLRAIEEEGIRARASQIIVEVTGDVALYILNYKRKKLAEIETRYNFQVLLRVDDEIASSEYRMEVSKPVEEEVVDAPTATVPVAEAPQSVSPKSDNNNDEDGEGDNNKRRRGRRGGRRRNNNNRSEQDGNVIEAAGEDVNGNVVDPSEKQLDEVKAPKAAEPKGAANDDKTDKVSPSEEKKPKGRGRKKAEPKEDVKVSSVEVADEKADKVEEKPKAKSKAKPKSKSKTDDVEVKKEEAPSKVKKTVKKQPEPANKDYEVVNQQPKEKKKGWWNRLTD